MRRLFAPRGAGGGRTPPRPPSAATPAPPLSPSHALGREGEAVAAVHLEGLGLVIRARNYAVEGGEIDLIAEAPAGEGKGGDGEGELVFCEVKARSYRSSAEPMLEAVPAGKRRRIARAALCYCQQHRLDRRMRFDVIAVGPGPDGRARVVEHLVGAFGCEGLRLDF